MEYDMKYMNVYVNISIRKTNIFGINDYMKYLTDLDYYCKKNIYI